MRYFSAVLLLLAVTVCSCQDTGRAPRERVPSAVSPAALREELPPVSQEVQVSEKATPEGVEDELEPGKFGTYRVKEGIHLTVPQAIARYGNFFGLDSEHNSLIGTGSAYKDPTVYGTYDVSFYRLAYDGVLVNGCGLTVYAQEGVFRQASSTIKQTPGAPTQPKIERFRAWEKLLKKAEVARPYLWELPGHSKEGLAELAELSIRIEDESQAGPKYRLLWNFEKGEHVYQLRRGAVDALTGEVVSIAPMYTR